MGRHRANPSWDYIQVHEVLKATFGPASDFPCSRCGKVGALMHWAYDHKDPLEQYDGKHGFPFSRDPEHYLPLCAHCHNRLDADFRDARRLAPLREG
jgi:hypothetical protein